MNRVREDCLVGSESLALGEKGSEGDMGALGASCVALLPLGSAHGVFPWRGTGHC